MKIRDLIKAIEKDGWRLARTRGSHRQYTHPAKPGIATISGHPGADVHPKTLRSVMIQAGIEPKP